MGPRFEIPEGMPRLSPGRHRSPRRGACFMEFASYLAGERWSDHPECTDPALAALARHVNDAVDDDARAGLVADVPRVIGLRDDRGLIGLAAALRAAAHALPVASMDRQHALALAILGLLPAARRSGIPARTIGAAQAALERAPGATRWAEARMIDWGVDESRLLRKGLEPIVHLAALGVAEACIHDPDAVLVAMLRAAISDAELLRAAPTDARVPQPA